MSIVIPGVESVKHWSEPALEPAHMLGIDVIEPSSPAASSGFVQSCTNGRIEEFCDTVNMAHERHAAAGGRGMVVPGSQWGKAIAKHEGVDRVFIETGFERRDADCSMCLGVNGNILAPEERCASTSNRNFEGRQGWKGRTPPMIAAMAAAAAVTGYLTDVWEIIQ